MQLKILINISTFSFASNQGIELSKAAMFFFQKVDLMSIFKLLYGDPELRINAYLSLITCSARPGVLQGIVDQLQNEKSQQVTFGASILLSGEVSNGIFPFRSDRSSGAIFQTCWKHPKCSAKPCERV